MNRKKNVAQVERVDVGLGWRGVALLALIASLGPITIDLYLPSLPHVADDFGVGASDAQWTLSAFIWGFALGQPFYGPMADRFGRRPVLIGALVAFIAVSVLCAFATSLETLVLGRLLQGMVGGAPMVVVRANVRDRLPADRAAPALAAISSMSALGPMLAPFLGGVMEAHFSWRAIFLGLAFWAGVLLLTVSVRLRESLDPAFRQPFSPRGVAHSYGVLLRDRFYVAHIMTGGLSFCGLFVFVSASSPLLQDIIGVSPQTYGLLFGASAACYVFGATTGGFLSGRVPAKTLLTVGVVCQLSAGLVLTALAQSFAPAPWMVSAPQGLYAFGAGFVFPQAVAGALSKHPERAGTASSLQSFLSFVMSGLAGLGALHAIDAATAQEASALTATGICVILCGLAAGAALTLARREIRRAEAVEPV